MKWTDLDELDFLQYLDDISNDSRLMNDEYLRKLTETTNWRNEE